jgi:uncharacterized membrane protein
MLLLAIVCPPVYFLCAKKWGMFFITAVMALIGLGTIFLIFPFLILWLIAMFMAVYHWKQQRLTKLMNEHAEKIGQSVAANLKQANG